MDFNEYEPRPSGRGSYSFRMDFARLSPLIYRRGRPFAAQHGEGVLGGEHRHGGTSVTFSKSSNPGSTRGSCSNTSSPAPAMTPSRSADASAASSTIGPRAV